MTRNSVARGVLLGLLLALTCVAALSFPPQSTVALKGSLQRICFDNPEQGRSGTRYFLVDDEGTSTEILLSDDLLKSLPGPPAPVAPSAEVRGEWIDINGRTLVKASSLSIAHETPRVAMHADGKSKAAILGTQPWLVVLCKFSDKSAEPRDVAYYERLLSSEIPGMDHYWREASYGKINLENSRVVGWYILPHPSSYYIYGNPPWLDVMRAWRDATAAADADVYFPAYAGVALIFNDVLGEPYLGFGGPVTWTLDRVNRTWGATWLPATLLHTVYGHDRDTNHHGFAHEMGHAMGLPHSSSSYGDTYDNFWDLMSHWGSSSTDPLFGILAIHTTAYHKDLLGWIAPEEKYLAEPGTQRTVHVSQLAVPPASGFKMAEVPLPGAHPRFLTVEARRRVGYDAGLPGEGVVLYDVDPDRYASTQWSSAAEWRPGEVIDTDGNGFTGDEGAIQSPGEVFSDPANGVSIAVESASDSGFAVTINNNAKFLPYVAYGSGSQSTLVLANPSTSESVSGIAKFFDNGGNPLSLVIDGHERDGSFDFHLPAGSVQHFRTASDTGLHTGSVELGSDARLEASLLVAGPVGLAAISATALSSTALLFPTMLEPSRGIRSGVALSNPNDETVAVACAALSERGTVSAEAATSVMIPGHGQISFFIDELFPPLQPMNFRGALLATAPLPVNGVAILDAGPGQFATLPATPVDRVAESKLVGVVSTYAGQAGTAAAGDGSSGVARFSSPNDIVVDKDGNIYVADTSNHTIRKITPDGAVTTLAGVPGSSGSEDGTGTGARFSFPRALCVGENGTLFVADYGNHLIRKLTPEGAVTTLAGAAGQAGAADGPAASARFNGPRGVAVDQSGAVYVSDTSSNTIRRISPDGMVATIAGAAGVSGYLDANGANARFDSPQKMVMDSGGNVLVADYNNCVIRKISPQGEVTTFSGTAGLHGGMDGPASKALFGYPLGLAIDPQDNIYVADGYVIRRIATDGSVRTLAGSPKIGTNPNTSLTGSADGTGSEARFALPSGLAVHSSGDVFIADRYNHVIRRLAVHTLGETVSFAQFADGDGLSSTLVLVNPSPKTSCGGNIEFRDSRGQLLQVDLNGTRCDGVLPFRLEPGGMVRLTTPGTGALVTGSAKIMSDFAIGSALLFSGSLGLGGVGPSHAATGLSILIDTDDAQSLDTGVAFSNPGETGVMLTLTLRDENGNAVDGGTTEVNLPPRGQIARFPRELFGARLTGLARFRGVLQVQATAPVSATALRLSPGAMAASPVVH